MGKYYNILLPVPSSNGIYTYFSEDELTRGERAAVPFGRRNITGIVLGETTKPDFECKNIIKKYNESPLFSDKYLTFIETAAKYYANPAGLFLHGVISEKLLNAEFDYDLKDIEEHKVIDITLTDEQKAIVESVEMDKYNCHLIKGITGSGKTEIYQSIAKKVIATGKQVLYIVPEISLTPQLIERLSCRLGFKPSLFHYKITGKERKKNFTAFACGHSKFMLGARSSIFVPAKNIGLIIVDEEHESSFKQEEAPSYNLRDMAVLYASILNIPVILGSATPSLESIYNALNGKYTLHELNNRPKNAVLPDINLIDMKNCDVYGGLIAEPLYEALYQTVKDNNQAIILLNRKGYSTHLYCSQCGSPAMCLNCSVGLVSFKSKNLSSCRYCNTDYPRLKCSVCGGTVFKEYGAGTEKIEEFLENMFPNKVVRIDTENSSKIKNLEKNLKAFENKEANILVGTQLIAKGLHFPSVTLVGILGIDNMLCLPDFRAVEKTYQLLVQTAGRAGRENLKGTVYIQTLNTESPVFKFINKSDMDFYHWELERRNKYKYPPYTKMARITFSHTNKEKCIDITNITSKFIKSIKQTDANISYPVESALSKLNGRYRYEILIKSTSNAMLNKILNSAYNFFNEHKKGAAIMKIDKDPYYMM